LRLHASYFTDIRRLRGFQNHLLPIKPAASPGWKKRPSLKLRKMKKDSQDLQRKREDLKLRMNL
jgi:hypothetical protein